MKPTDEIKLDDTLTKLQTLPQHEKDRLECLSICSLIKGIERNGFECEGGPLISFTEWMELKARIASMSGLMENIRTPTAALADVPMPPA